jgi:hypothetical protein
MSCTSIPFTLSLAGSEGRAECASLLAVQVVQHCWLADEVSSDNSCRLYNTAAMAAAEATESTAVMVAVADSN